MSVGTRTVTLTLATAVTDGQVVTVSYGVPTSNRLQDVSGRNAPAFADFAVTNNTDALVSNTHLSPAGRWQTCFKLRASQRAPTRVATRSPQVDIWLGDASGTKYQCQDQEEQRRQ